jgi:tight adherence protein C
VSGIIAGSLVGLGLGAGIVLMLAGVPVLRRPGLDVRLAPYLGLPRTTTARNVTGGGGLQRLTRRVSAALGGGESVRRRLQRAGRTPDLEAFRAEQVLWAAAGLLSGGVLSALVWWHGTTSVAALVVLVLLSGVASFAARDWLLGRQAAQREQRMLGEFPTIADLLALSVAAGEGAVAALERVVRVSSGELCVELRRALADVRAGAALTDALGALAGRTELPALARFVDGVVVAVERGTPLADVLKAQAQDVREARQRALVEAAGRKEIGMMVPVVFLVLPVTVIFAVYPGFAFMRLSL